MVCRFIQADGLSKSALKEIADKSASLGPGLVEVTIHRIPAHRVSERVRRYYWMLVRLICDHVADLTGEKVSPDTMHDKIAHDYLSEAFLNFDTMMPYKDRYSHIFLDTKRLADVCKHLQEYWAERGLYLPDPHEDSYDFT